MDYAKPDPLRLIPSSVSVFEEQGREDGNALLSAPHESPALEPGRESAHVTGVWLLFPDEHRVVPTVIPEGCRCFQVGTEQF
jgi:hypothetical protein